MAEFCYDANFTGTGGDSPPLQTCCIFQRNAIVNCLTVILGARHTALRLIAQNLLRVHAFADRNAFHAACQRRVLQHLTRNGK